ncbi:M20/M25/M40 family metallo-hydrolase [Sphingosinicella sp. LHD-64]|uniref:M20/M25/M40 family metallo-hydrolase n=1 Tax=Sphingosinicella sp. LHD-64 TaxID=3072139 RepID=UPI00280CA34D|nr:M20/M25/M40 family metallo-hydrolase [Sphingosinicella sp. LHD-64]MDQ8757299.1 M20/M25/M40 family metallo-hydrolase [Sphingosinicella sp. LHD-64]
MRWFVLLLLFLATGAAAAPREWVDGHRQQILDEYLPLLAIPNVAANRADIRRNADHIVAMMARRDLAPRLLESEDGTAPPLIYGEWRVPGATRTYILYAHYDGQPVTPEDWTVTPPFEPRLVGEGREARIYARSASDDKAGVMAILAAVDALRAENRRPAFNLKIVFEGEEEAGSPHLAALLRRHRETLASDGWVIVDGPAHQSGPPQLTLGVRGDVNMEVTVHGPARPLHSGHYGNWAPNPALMLAELLASMKDETGRVTISGFYDDVIPLTDAERAAIAAVPAPDASLRNELGLGWTEGDGATLTELINRPSLNINGMRSADVGANGRNVIPTQATAALDLRLVLGNTPDRQVQRVVDHIRAQGYEVLDRAPTIAERRRFPRIATVTREPGYPAERTPLDHPLAQSLSRAMRANGPFVLLPSLGGSLPLYLIRQELGAPSVTVALWNHDNNQHAEDENVRIDSLMNGIVTIAGIMTAE